MCPDRAAARGREAIVQHASAGVFRDSPYHQVCSRLLVWFQLVQGLAGVFGCRGFNGLLLDREEAERLTNLADLWY